MKRRRIQVLCLQETRWKGTKAREIGEGVKLYYNGEDTKRNRVGIAVAESLKDSVEAVQRINDRIMSLRLDTKEGDMNGHVRSGRRIVERVHGGKGIGLINQDGERILDLALSHNLAVCTTFFAKRESQKVTYASGGRRTEVDHILVRRAALKTVRDVKVIPGEDVASQHRSDGGDCGAQSATSYKGVHEVGLPDPTGPVNETWRRVTQTILRCARKVLGETKGGTRGDKAAWFWREEVQVAVKKKKEA
ncbi:unnamed protein product [Heligmosomoides polygyrus]|uniref:RNase H domain-containing protein n=1 Tax=Heligmosomoides polygyrus TaxID=6339 RepID=A0A183FXW3_HELPZ|nr:unnamed protein product [Heligmosomoides polygyrus]